MFKGIIASILLLTGYASARNMVGFCALPPLQEEFDPRRYAGLWNEQRRDPETSGQPFDCTQGRYTYNPDGTLGALNSQYDAKNDKFYSASAVGTFKGASGKLKFTFSERLGDYRVVYTDYDQVAIVYSCQSAEDLFANTELVWILTRSQDPSEEIISKAKAIVKERLPDYDQAKFRVTKHGPSNNCKYLPAPSYE